MELTIYCFVVWNESILSWESTPYWFFILKLRAFLNLVLQLIGLFTQRLQNDMNFWTFDIFSKFLKISGIFLIFWLKFFRNEIFNVHKLFRNKNTCKFSLFKTNMHLYLKFIFKINLKIPGLYQHITYQLLTTKFNLQISEKKLKLGYLIFIFQKLLRTVLISSIFLQYCMLY
jgi:hypothetical protein